MRHFTRDGKNGSSNLLTQYRWQPRSTRTVVGLPTASALSQKNGQIALQSVSIIKPRFLKATSCITSCTTEVNGGEGLKLVKLANNSASSCRKPCASLKNTPRILAVRRSLSLIRKKHAAARDQLSPQKLPVRAFDSRAQGFITTLARQRSSFPPLSPNLLLTHSIKRATVLLRVMRALPGCPRQ